MLAYAPYNIEHNIMDDEDSICDMYMQINPITTNKLYVRIDLRTYL